MSTATPPTETRAIIYVRQSKYREESASLDMQETSARDYCTRHGYHVVDVISDRLTGRKWDKRPGIQHVMKRIEHGDAERVIVWRWSRLSRKGVHQHLAIDTLEQLGCVVESSTEPFDTKTAGGQFGRDVMLASASFDSAQKSEQWRETHERRVRDGLPAAGRPRFGYDWYHGNGETERYEINADEAEVVTWLYSSFTAGHGVPSLVRELNRRGIASKNGTEWSRRKLTTYMESGFAAGLLVQTVQRAGSEYERITFAEREFLPGAHAAILSEQQWADYRAVKLGRSTRPPRTINAGNLLSGLVMCADCSGPMTRHVTKSGGPNQYVSFVCANRASGKNVRSCSITEPRLHSLVLEWLDGVADEIGEAAERAAQAEQVQLRTRTDSEAAAREIAEIDKQLATLTRQLVAGRVPESAYDVARDELLTERSKAVERQTIAEAATRRGDEEPAHVIASGLLAEWHTLPADERNTLLGKLIRRVIVTPPERPRGGATPRVVAMWEDDEAVTSDNGSVF